MAKRERRAQLRSLLPFAFCVISVTALQLTTIDGLVCQPAEDPSPHSTAELIPEVQSIRPGEPFTVALRITMDAGWHSYWLNPGDAGQPASIDWEIPSGFRAGDIRWPYPRTVEESTVVSYGYEDEVVLLTEISPPRFMTTGQMVKFAATARWLVCNNICLPARADLKFELRLTENSPIPDESRAVMFAETRGRLPRQADNWEMSVITDDGSIVLHIKTTDTPERSFEGAHFYPSERSVIEHAAPQIVTHQNGVTQIVLRKSRFPRPPLIRLTGVLVLPNYEGVETISEIALAVDALVSEPTS